MTSRDIQAQQTKTKIMQACIEMMETHDLNDIKITDICKKTELSVGAFYHHFHTKYDILLAIDKELDVYFFDKILPLCLEMEPIEGLIHYFCCQSDNVNSYGVHVIKNLYKAQLDTPDFLTEFKQNRHFPEGVRVLLKKAVEEKILSEQTDIEELLSELLSINHGIFYTWCLSDGLLDIKTYTRTIMNHYLNDYIK